MMLKLSGSSAIRPCARTRRTTVAVRASDGVESLLARDMKKAKVQAELADESPFGKAPASGAKEPVVEAQVVEAAPQQQEVVRSRRRRQENMAAAQSGKEGASG